MNIFVAMIVLALSIDGSERTFSVGLHIDRNPSCLKDARIVDKLTPKLEWKGDSTAVVTVVKFDEFNTVTAERAPRAELIGEDLNLCYNYEPPVMQKEPIPMCGAPALLTFTVSDIPQGKYRVFVAPCWPAG